MILARSGYSTSQELVLFEEEAFQYHPDLIVWSYVLNDPAHPVYHNANGEVGRFWYKPTYHTRHFLEKKLFILKETIHKWHCAKEFHQFLHCAYRKQIEENLTKIGDIAKSNYVPVVFLIHPIFEKAKTYTEYSLHGVHTMLKSIAMASDLIVWDVYEVFQYYNPNDLNEVGDGKRHDPWHPNQQGHMIIASYLYNKLIEAQLVK